MTDTYCIKRFFSEEGKPAAIVFRGLNLEEAKKHCNDSKTRKEGVWFDGYTKE